MNVGTLIGFIISVAVFGASVFLSFPNFKVLFDIHAALIVFGGTLAVTLICFPIQQIASLLRVFIGRVLGHHKRDKVALIKELVRLSESYRKGKKFFQTALSSVKDPFLKGAGEVLYWLEAEVSREELNQLLTNRVKTQLTLQLEEAKVFRIISKFPPAFGLMGTTMGMIAILQSLGDPQGKNLIGPSMSVALVATLYGLVLTNLILVPIAENLTKQTKEDTILKTIVVEGMMLIADNKPTKYVEEKLKSFLLPVAAEKIPFSKKVA
jgi:chemotaxis protein MotA